MRAPAGSSEPRGRAHVEHERIDRDFFAQGPHISSGPCVVVGRGGDGMPRSDSGCLDPEQAPRAGGMRGGRSRAGDVPSTRALAWLSRARQAHRIPHVHRKKHMRGRKPTQEARNRASRLRRGSARKRRTGSGARRGACEAARWRRKALAFPKPLRAAWAMRASSPPRFASCLRGHGARSSSSSRSWSGRRFPAETQRLYAGR